jgi:hypothetical protein
MPCILPLEEGGSAEVLISIYETTRRHIPDDSTLHNRLRDNLRYLSSSCRRSLPNDADRIACACYFSGCWAPYDTRDPRRLASRCCNELSLLMATSGLFDSCLLQTIGPCWVIRSARLQNKLCAAGLEVLTVVVVKSRLLSSGV